MARLSIYNVKVQLSSSINLFHITLNMKAVLTNLRDLIYEQDSIRNMTVIAHVDHGKTTLTDILISKSGMLSEDRAGNMLKTDTMEEEQKRGISIKATSISLFYEKKEEVEKEGEKIEVKKPHIIHLIIIIEMK